MLWYKRRAEDGAESDGIEVIRPATLAIDFDRQITQAKLDAFLASVDESTITIDMILASLLAKQELMRNVFPRRQPDKWQIDVDQIQIVLSTVFTARRKLSRLVSEISPQTLIDQLTALVYGRNPLTERLHAFTDLASDDAKKEKRALWDLGAEILHFRDPDNVPLMTRWVWDDATMSGALREFIRGNDHMQRIPLDKRPETFEGARLWFAEFLQEAGFYREIPMIIDLLHAQAYADYVKAMATGMGMVQAEFGGTQDPLEFILKLLGVGDTQSGHVDAGHQKSCIDYGINGE